MDLRAYLTKAVDAISEWEGRWSAFAPHPSVRLDEDRLAHAFDEYVGRLAGNYPFFHPRYAGQMLKPPHPAAVVGYVAAMLINPNNHALDGGPPTSEMEKEVVADLAAMFGFPSDALGHLTSSGTIANLEAAWVARETHPDKGIAFSDQAHYTHDRLADLLRVEPVVIPSHPDGRIRLDALEEAVRSGRVGTIVLTAGTTAVGAVDPIDDVLSWRDRYGIRIHVDAAYGGFFTLLADDPDSPLDAQTRRHYRAIAQCDSVAVDPHKHGLQPYGCGCILFRDPRVGRVYRHDSPYTYFTSDALHLGEISFECSRAGAAAGALWLTLQLLPLEGRSGLGRVLAVGVRAARRLHDELSDSEALRPFTAPALDILTYFPDATTTSAIDQASQELFQYLMEHDDPLYVSVMKTEAVRLAELHRDVIADGDTVRILRSVLMKPEHEAHVEMLRDGLIDAVHEIHH